MSLSFTASCLKNPTDGLSRVGSKAPLRVGTLEKSLRERSDKCHKKTHVGLIVLLSTISECCAAVIDKRLELVPHFLACGLLSLKLLL
jgi:hypothetical protein